MTAQMEHYPWDDHTAILIGHYIEDILTEDEAKELLTRVRSDRELLRTLALCSYVDLQLVTLGDDRRDGEVTQEGIGQNLSLIRALSDVPLDELIRQQNAEKPIIHPESNWKEEEQSQSPWFYRLVCKYLWINRKEWEGSIVPVIAPLILLFVIGIVCMSTFEYMTSPVFNEPIPTLGRVNNVIDAVWKDNATVFEPGEFVNESRFQLEKGLVQLEMNNGAKLILEGPTDLTLNSNLSAFCLSGQVSAHVPQTASGFTISTPLGDVIDQGTEFVALVDQKNLQVDVIRGKVDIKSPKCGLFQLNIDESLFFDPHKGGKRSPVSKVTRFRSNSYFEKESRKKASQILETRNINNKKADADPNCLVRVDFNTKKVSQIRNSALAGPSPHLRIAGGGFCNGQVSGTRALRFTNPDGEVTMNLPGEYKKLLIEQKIRLPAIIKPTSVLLSSDLFREEPGFALWQITGNGTLNLQISETAGRPPKVFNSAPLGDQFRPGKWVTIRMTIDIPSNRVTQFVNDQVVGTHAWNGPDHFQLGHFTIGNVDRVQRSATDRHFTGSLAELRIATF